MRQMFAQAQRLWVKTYGTKPIGDVEVMVKEPQLPTIIWMPNEHEPLCAVLDTLPQLAEHDIDNAQAVFHRKGKQIYVNTPNILHTYFQMENRGPLLVTVPRKGLVERTLLRTGIKSNPNSGKAIKFVKNRLTKSAVDEEEVLRQEKSMADEFKLSQARVTGDVKDYSGVDITKWQEMVATLQGDGMPQKTVNGLERVLMMDKCSEKIFDLVYEGGLLKAAFVVDLIGVQRDGGKVDVLLAHYEMSFNTNPSSAPTTGQLSFEHTMQLQRLLEQKAQLYWKQKTDKDDDYDMLA